MDVLTFGETMLRLTPPRNQRLAQASEWEVWVAGSESNVVAGLCALGLSCAWVSRLPDNAIGRKIADAISARGVDVSHVIWATAEERAGLFYAEPGVAPRAATVIYDRAGSAASAMTPDVLPHALLNAHRHLHVSGITPALSTRCAETATDAVQRAKGRNLSVSLDINYRAKLWPPQAAAETLSGLAAMADVVFCSRNDAALLFGAQGEIAAQAQTLRERFGCSIAVVTAGGDGAAGWGAQGGCAVPAVPLETAVERFGSGDAFAAGFLAAHLRGAALKDALRLGTAAAALKRTIPGDMLIATRAEIESVAAREEGLFWR